MLPPTFHRPNSMRVASQLRHRGPRIHAQRPARRAYAKLAFAPHFSRPGSRPQTWLSKTSPTTGLMQRRNIFIQTESTPNSDALKFLPSIQILPKTSSSPFLEYLSPRSTLSPPHPSPLASRLFNVDGITGVFYGQDFITITKAPDANWAHVKPEVFSLITEALNNGDEIVGTPSTADNMTSEDSSSQRDSLEHDEKDSEVVSLIKELLDTRIRPAIQEDGGDIDYRGFENGKVLLKLRGACRTCDSSTVTLRNGIESMLMHYIEEVKGIEQVLDPEEEIAAKEFERFEQRLSQQKRPQTSV